MQVWKITIRPDPQEADLAQGYALADSAADVLEMIDHPDAMVFWKHPDTPWPGKLDERIMWTSGWPVKFRLSTIH